MIFRFVRSIPILTLALLLGYSSTNLATPAPTSPVDKASPTSEPTTKLTKFQTLSDTVVIPGERVGPVTRNTTRQDLVKQFGQNRLQDRAVSIGEGFTEPGTRVNPGVDRSFTVVWTDTSRTRPKEIRNLGPAWRTPEGIGVGTSLAQLQQTLGSFKFYGFGWDYSGTVLLEGTKLAKYKNALILRLRTAPGVAEKFPDDLRAVEGDGLFSSTNPHLRSLKPQVGEMIVRLAANP